MVSVTLDDIERIGDLPDRGTPAARVPRLADGRVDAHAAARQLIAEVAGDPWGHMSASVYETARLVTLAPWLTGHARRIAFLLGTQRVDGSWDAPEGYSLVPTLSATEALLTTLHRVAGGRAPAVPSSPARLLRAANRALSAVSGVLRAPTDIAIPDTPAVEIIVPALVAALNQHLERLSDAPLPGLDASAVRASLRLPRSLDGATVAAIRAHLRTGAAVPAKLLHSLEIADGHARRASGVRPVPPGTVGASPAATAAWLGDEPASQADPAAQYLSAVVGRHAGPVPSVVPVTVFERAWVLNTLATAGLHARVPAQLPASILELLDDAGTPGGAGLPADADTTGAALLALARLGRPQALDCLWTFETSSHFVTWHGERTASTTTNAHVLDAIAHAAGTATGSTPRARTAGQKVSRWLRDQQREDGSWVDKWHASAYYATTCCALALHNFGGQDAAVAVRRAAAWVLDSQRADGGWGRWASTAEETAYALHVLLLTTPPGPRRNAAAARGYGYLSGHADRPDRPPLWHDKDLYTPHAVVQAAVIAALHLAQEEPAVLTLAGRR
jgi:halimadienyl-diphosphate synthase